MAKGLLIQVVVRLESHLGGGVRPASRLHPHGEGGRDAAAALDELLELVGIEAGAQRGAAGRLIPWAALANHVAGMGTIAREAHGSPRKIVNQIDVANLVVDEAEDDRLNSDGPRPLAAHGGREVGA